MAERYSKVQSSIWNSDKFNSINEFAQKVYLYLLSCPHGNSAGFFKIPTGYALTDLRCSEKRFKNAISLLENAELISYSDEVVFIKQFLRFNTYMNVNHAKGSQKEIEQFESNPLYELFYKDIETFCEPFAYLFSEPKAGYRDSIETVSKGYRDCCDTKTKTKTKTKTSTETNTNTDSAPAPDAPAKTKYADFVSMTNDEYTSLVAKLGEDGTKRCIEILDNYKGANGKKYKSDYRAILNWVVSRYEEERTKGVRHGSNSGNNATPAGGGATYQGKQYSTVLDDESEDE